MVPGQGQWFQTVGSPNTTVSSTMLNNVVECSSILYVPNTTNSLTKVTVDSRNEKSN